MSQNQSTKQNLAIQQNRCVKAEIVENLTHQDIESSDEESEGKNTSINSNEGFDSAQSDEFDDQDFNVFK